MEYPVHYSNAAAAIAASAKSVYFGNWYYMGLREGPSLTILRDPYSVDGITLIKYGFRLCYGVLIAGGIAYGAHPSA
jgi:HK97 family phage major capsid protein